MYKNNKNLLLGNHNFLKKTMKKSLIFLFILLYGSVYSQITLHFKDTISNKPSPYIMVSNEDTEIIGTSNELGEVYLKKDNKLTNSLFIESIFYEKKRIQASELEDNSIILLKPIVNLLDEIVITAPKKKYLVLTAYYRIYNTTDDILDSFVDAEVKYIMKKNSFKKKVTNFRIFDTIPYENFKKISPYWVSGLKKTTLFERLNSKFHLIKNEKDGVINIVGKKNHMLYGTIRADVNIKNNSNIIITALKDSEYFNNIATEEYNSKELLTTTIKDLKYKCNIANIIVTDKMIEINPHLKDRKKRVNKKEVFIQSVEYISKEDLKKLEKMGYKDTSISHYTKEFWKNLETFTPLDPSIEKQLNNLLVERK